MKKSITGYSLLTGLLASSLFATSAFAAPLQPVTHANWMKEQKIISDLSLDRNITLAEVAVTMTKVKGATLGAAQGKAHWATPALQWLEKQGALTAAEVKTPAVNVSSDKAIAIAKKLGYDLKVDKKATLTRGDFLQAIGDAITTHVTIAHTNDVHGHIDENESGKEFGYAKMSTLIKEWREENKNFLLLDAGDTFQGTIFVNQFKGESVLPILNHLNYNTMAAGNHEFDFGYEQLLKLRDQLKYPVINANVVKEDGTNLLVPVYKTEINGKKFAFLGFVAEDTPILTHPDNVKGLTFKSPVEVAKKMVPELKKEVDHVVVVSHIGIDVDREVAKAVDGIDLIVGGHSHTPLRQPEKVNGTYIVQDWEYGKSLGRADLFYYKNKLVGFSGGLVEYDKNVKPDPEVEKLVKDVVNKVDNAMKVVIAKAEVPLDGDRELVRKQETNIGNLIADVMREKTQSIKGHEADIAITNGGGIRTQLPAGDITKKDLYTLLPFPNTLVIIEATGDEIVKAMEVGVSEVEKGAGRFPHISGMSFSYNPTKPAGQRLVEVKVAGNPIDLKKTYRIATNDFIATGGDGYSTLKKPAFDTGFTLYSIMEDAFKERKVIAPKVEGRVVEVK
ncbi:bifunctional metallophosphatase/5'-nucleotidase [Brevibacillus laterosporus]|uniref:bifunctional metallophosphatase/5'-nucleotidase n=1 Tax=Brevibacillus laterosporus TaxID=1465 RepID=UPI000EB5A21B|nr:5'-nucleotidase C-terminal domain-containing protein [Brevibacillus laterosporus]AYK06749.1 bifunctional metallophosphatase/5'-nucleotidase [Brevibacillus laterosporus]